jgi:tRNA/rRNA methyltransferase
MHTAILVEPEIPENTGFIARLAANFDFRLRIVNPEFNLEEARKTAKNAQGKLRNAKIFDSVEESVEDLEYIVGTKPGRGKRVGSFEPKENTSVMIGRESSGLSNEELELCDAVVYIETSGYSSLNQSHAAGILFHKFQSWDRRENGANQGQLNKLEEVLPETVCQTLLEANPSKSKVDRILGELSQNSI